MPSSARVLILLAGLCLAVRTARAADLYTYDLDSLCHLATDIVEAKVVKSPADERISSIDFQVTQVHKGDLRPEQTVHVVRAGWYSKRKGDEFFSSQPLAVDDVVFLFLRRTWPREAEFFPPDIRNEV